MSLPISHISRLLLPPDYARAAQEFRSGSRDGAVLGLEVIGNALKERCPGIYQFLNKEGGSAFILQKKICHTLSSFSDNESLSIADQRFKNRLRTIDGLAKLSLEYGSAHTKNAFLCLKTPIREKLDRGDAPLADYQDKMIRQIEKGPFEFPLPKRLQLPSLPTEEERKEYWKQLRIATRSKAGHIGVFYTYSPCFMEDLVVKAPIRAAQECFASRIFQSLGFMTPDTLVIDRYSKEGKLIEQALSPFEEFQNHCRTIPFQKYFVMNRVHGRAFEEIDEATAKAAFTNDKICLYSILEQIGQIAAVDVFLYYQDRFSHIGYSNLGNLMCLEQQGGRITTAVAIDQSIDLSKPNSGFVAAKSKLEIIHEVLGDVLNSDGRISSAAVALWNDIPDHLKQYVNEQDGLHRLQQGLVDGFQAIAERITPELLHQIDAELKPEYTQNDFIHLVDFETVLEMIQNKVQLEMAFSVLDKK